jgi:hypothetical protein
MLKKILVGVAGLLLVLVVIVALQPSAFRIERSITMAAPPEQAFAQVNDFHAWKAWSPWEGKDPALRRTFSGPGSGVGAAYAWAGNDEVGEGRMTIEESVVPSRIAIKLEFLKPFAATNRAIYGFAPTAGGTKVTWSMEGNNNFVMKAFGLFMDVDKMLGRDFERGLASMKAIAEQAARHPVGAVSVAR